MAGMAAGAIEAAVHNGDECLLTVTIPSTGEWNLQGSM
jgi:hypothetical protein